jgi:threonyl-tRNA synthetase
MIVIGKKEVENNTITLRFKDGKQENNLTFESLIDKCKSQDN